MKERINLDGLIIGTAFTVGSLLLTWTFFIPIISVFPGVMIGALVRRLIDANRTAANVTILLLTALFITTLSVALFRIRRTARREGEISKAGIAGVMTVMYLIVHALGFYLYWALALDYRGDGQLIFAAVDSFPKSSWAFIPIGLAIDGVKNFKQRQVR